MIPIMEDYDFCQRLKNQGKIFIVRDSVITSSRRFLKRGIMKQQIINEIIKMLYWLRVPPARLLSIYNAQ